MLFTAPRSIPQPRASLQRTPFAAVVNGASVQASPPAGFDAQKYPIVARHYFGLPSPEAGLAAEIDPAALAATGSDR